MAKIFILAGEPSGDLHGSYVVKQLLQKKPGIEIKAWGGDMMRSAGAEILRSLDHLAFMGFVEVAKNFTKILQNFRLCKAQISQFDPDVIVFIDYPGFNLRMAKWAKTNGYKTIQYIAPAAWAWKENRVKTIKKYIDELLVILPFEKAFFGKHGIDAHFVGHPLIEQLEAWKPDPEFKLSNLSKEQKAIALFPGSRLQEIVRILPKMMDFAKLEDNFKFYIVVPDYLALDIYSDFLEGVDNVDLIKGQTYDLLSHVDLAIVSSGTATLEVALMSVPQVVCYETNQISFSIAKQLVKSKYISLVNLIAGKQVVTELLQTTFVSSNLQKEVKKLSEHDYKKLILKDYADIQDMLTRQSASENASNIILLSLTAS